jgi:hypothetical protein
MNNLHGREHEKIFGHQAFFDLNLFGQQAAMLRNIPSQQECIVVSYKNKKRADKDPIVEFKTYILQKEAFCESENVGVFCRVFFGEIKETISMLKSEALKMPSYAPLFNKVGHFKQRSIIEFSKLTDK